MGFLFRAVCLFRGLAGSVRFNSTIFALSSGQGKCGVAVIRVSGPDSGPALLSLTNRDHLPPPRRLVLRPLFGPICAGRRLLLDRALVVWMPGPHTFTGEPCCELHVHGGVAVVSAVLDALQVLPGLAPAAPGQFTRRAFHNHRLDMTQVEGLADLIHAETEYQRRQAVRQADGELARLYSGWRQRLLKCLASAEAFIDFSEEDQIDVGVLDRVTSDSELLRSEIDRHLQDARRGQRLRDGLRVIIGGAVNAGKSSLLNRLVRRNAAIVSSVPGTTRDTIETIVDLQGLPVVLTDTAGLRESEDVVEKEGVRRARDCLASADLVVLVVDCRHALDWLQQQDACHSTLESFMTHYRSLLQLPDTASATLLVLNKSDLIGCEQRALLQPWLDCGRAVLVSCVHDDFGSYTEWLADHLRPLCAVSADSVIPNRQRYEHHLREAAAYLAKLPEAIDHDLAVGVQQLRSALSQLGQVTGHVHTEQLLDTLFADFCIGK